MGGSTGSPCTLKNLSTLFFIEWVLMISFIGTCILIFAKTLSMSMFKSISLVFGKVGVGRS